MAQLVASARKNFVVLYEYNKIYLKSSLKVGDFSKTIPLFRRRRIIQSKTDSNRIRFQKLEAVYNNLSTSLDLYCQKHHI